MPPAQTKPAGEANERCAGGPRPRPGAQYTQDRRSGLEEYQLAASCSCQLSLSYVRWRRWSRQPAPLSQGGRWRVAAASRLSSLHPAAHSIQDASGSNLRLRCALSTPFFLFLIFAWMQLHWCVVGHRNATRGVSHHRSTSQDANAPGPVGKHRESSSMVSNAQREQEALERPASAAHLTMERMIATKRPKHWTMKIPASGVGGSFSSPVLQHQEGCSQVQGAAGRSCCVITPAAAAGARCCFSGKSVLRCLNRRRRIRPQTTNLRLSPPGSLRLAPCAVARAAVSGWLAG